MELLLLAVLVVVAVGIAIGVHTGPHGMVAAGAVGFAACIGLLVGVALAAPTGTRSLVEWTLLIGAFVVSGVAVAAGLFMIPAMRHRQPAVAPGRLWGADGVAVTDLTPVGTVRVRGETWTAESLSGRLPAGAPVHVIEVEGLRLRVASDAVEPSELSQSAGDEERT